MIENLVAWLMGIVAFLLLLGIFRWGTRSLTSPIPTRDLNTLESEQVAYLNKLSFFGYLVFILFLAGLILPFMLFRLSPAGAEDYLAKTPLGFLQACAMKKGEEILSV